MPAHASAFETAHPGAISKELLDGISSKYIVSVENGKLNAEQVT